MTLNDRFRAIEEEKRQHGDQQTLSPRSNDPRRTSNVLGGSMRSVGDQSSNVHIPAINRLSMGPRTNIYRKDSRPSKSQNSVNRVLAGRIGPRNLERTSSQGKIASRLSGQKVNQSFDAGRRDFKPTQKQTSGRGRGRPGGAVSRETLDAQLDAYMSKVV